MNKMFLKIMAILGFIAFADAHAMRRVDSPGVAQRKLNLLIKNAREMTESEKQQALADLSPSLKADYQDALDNMSVRDRKDFEVACATLVRPIIEGLIDNKEKLDELTRGLIGEFKLTSSEGEKLKDFAEKYFENHKGKGTTDDKGNLANEKLLDLLETKDEEGQEKFAQFLSALKLRITQQFGEDLKPKKASEELKADFKSVYPEWDKKINGFLAQMMVYAAQWTSSTSSVQSAYKFFFPLMTDLNEEQSRLELSNKEALQNLLDIMNLGEKVANNLIKPNLDDKSSEIAKQYDSFKKQRDLLADKILKIAFGEIKK